jgi:AcrR family transcriptional regulator
MDLRRPVRRPLPRGAHGLTREYVAADQRARLLDAMADAAAEHGYAEMTVAHVLEGARVSRRTFYEHFEDKLDCFVATYEVIVRQATDRIVAAHRRGEPWPTQVRTWLTTLCEFVAAEPSFARVLLVEPLTAGGHALERHSEAVRSAIPFLARGREQPGCPPGLPESIEEEVAGGLASIGYWWVVAGQTSELSGRLPELVYFALLPYLGHDAALAESRSS